MLRPAFLLLLLTPMLSLAQKADRQLIKALQTDIAFLASDALEGRMTGSEGERKAAEYLVARYEKLKIPAFGAAYRHPFTFIHGREPGASRIVLGGQSNLLGGEAFPLPFSSNGSVSGEVLIEVQELGAIWMLPLYASAEEAANPQFDWEKSAWAQSRQAIKDGAAGIVFYDSYGSIHAHRFNALSEHEALGVPIAFVGHRQWKDLTASDANMVSVTLDIQLSTPRRSAANVLAYIDNKAPLTVVIGAHYDHLGHGESGNSLYPGDDRPIHNGADDNASGTAAVLQLAERLKKGRLRRYNYLFAHFSGSELGLLGSKDLCREAGIDSSRVACMINLDMIGRLQDSTQELTLGGWGSSPAWAPLPEALRKAGFSVQVDTAGSGPSDHAAFYDAGIPVLFFSTGAHPAYHHPDDDAAGINYAGEARIISGIEGILRRLDGAPRPPFTPVAVRGGTVRRKGATGAGGILTDESWQGDGVRVAGVTSGRPAAMAGLQRGDLIIRIGGARISGLQRYLEVTGSLPAGEAATIDIIRDGKELRLRVRFDR